MKDVHYVLSPFGTFGAPGSVFFLVSNGANGVAHIYVPLSADDYSSLGCKPFIGQCLGVVLLLVLLVLATLQTLIWASLNQNHSLHPCMIFILVIVDEIICSSVL